nr:hypothetical protein [Campylobacter sp.]
MTYETTLTTKFLVFLQTLMFNYNPYFLDLIILFLVIFWVCFILSVIKFKSSKP